MIYFITGIIGSIFQVFIFSESVIPLIGASGAISGIMGFYVTLFPMRKIKTLFLNKFLDVPAFFYFGFWIFIEIIISLLQVIFHAQYVTATFAHITSAAAGVTIAFIYKLIESNKVTN